MPMVAVPTQPRPRRRADTVAENVTFERAVFDLLMRYCPSGRKSLPMVIQLLVDEHDAREHGRVHIPHFLWPYILEEGMPTVDASQPPQHSRHADAVTLNITLQRDTSALLRRYCPPGTRRKRQFLARLVYEHHARVQERVALIQTVAALGLVKEEV